MDRGMFAGRKEAERRWGGEEEKGEMHQARGS